TEFSGQGTDHSEAQIIGRRSRDGGRSWGKARVLQKNTGGKNVMSVTLRRLGAPGRHEGPIGLFFLQKNSMSDLGTKLRISLDEAESFGGVLPVSTTPGYDVMNNDRVTRLSSGRLLAPVASTADVKKNNHFVSFCNISDDGGLSWRKGAGEVDYEKRGAMEPEVIELEDGRVAMILRTQLGHIAASYSQDEGETWTEAQSWGVRAPEAPATLRRIPSTGDLLLVWNDTRTPGENHSGKRNPLTAAVSSDEGKTWRQARNLEKDPGQTYSYVSLVFARGRAVMSYYVRDEETRRISSRFRSLPIGWFYESD
ncbi:MAG: sialidase family protein, partial [Verrucomicrobiales bacterium]